jgi:hypothetical protein
MPKATLKNVKEKSEVDYTDFGASVRIESKNRHHTITKEDFEKQYEPITDKKEK